MTSKVNTNLDHVGQVCLMFNQDDIFNMLAVLDSGIKRKSIQLAHHLEMEQTVAAEIIDRQIKFGELVLSKLEDLVEYPSDEEINAIVDSMDTTHD